MDKARTEFSEATCCSVENSSINDFNGLDAGKQMPVIAVRIYYE